MEIYVYIIGLIFCIGFLVFYILNNPNKIEKYDKFFSSKSEKKTKNTFDKSVLDIIPIAGYDDDMDCFIYGDGSYMDIMKIKARNLADLSEDDKELMKMKYSRWFKKYGPDIKLIMMNFPSDVTNQIKYWEKKSESTYNPIFREWQQKKIAELKWIEKNRTTREFYFMYWGQDKDFMYKNREMHIESLGTGPLGYIEFLPRIKKEDILFKFNNMNSVIQHSKEK